MDNGKYYKIQNDNKGKYIHNRQLFKPKLYAADTVFNNNNVFVEGFVNVLQKVRRYDESYTNFIINTHNRLITRSIIPVGFIEEEQDERRGNCPRLCISNLRRGGRV